MWNQAFLGQVRLVRMPYLGQVVAADQPPFDGCERIGYNRSPFMESELQAKIEEAKAAGRSVTATPTGRILNQGSRSETVETVYWSCPPQYAQQEQPDQTAVPWPAPTPAAAPSEFPVVPVVGGLAAAGLLAYLSFG